MKTLKHVVLSVVLVCFALLSVNEANAANCFSRKVLGPFLEQPVLAELIGELERVEAITNDTEAIARLAQKIDRLLEKDRDNFILHYLRARADFVEGNYYVELKKNKKKGVVSLERALQHVEKSIDLQDDFSDSYRLASDIYGWLIDLKLSMLYGPFYGPKSDKLWKKAQRYNPENPEVYLAAGRKYLYAPIIVGGNRKKAVESFEKAIGLCPTYYLAHIWLSQAYVARGRIQEAVAPLQKAIALEPQSQWAKEELEKLAKADGK